MVHALWKEAELENSRGEEQANTESWHNHLCIQAAAKGGVRSVALPQLGSTLISMACVAT